MNQQHFGHVELNPTFYTTLAKAHAFLPEKARNAIAIAKMVFEDMLSYFTTPLEVCLRRRFGVRHMSLYQFVRMCSQLCIAAIFRDVAMTVFLLSAVSLGGWHMYEARRWEKSGMPWRYTYFIGESWPFWDWLRRKLKQRGVRADRALLPDMVYRFGEPALCLVIGLLIWPVFRLPGLFFIVASVFLLLKMHLLHQRLVAMLRDKNDALVTGQMLSEFSDPVGSRQTAAASVVRLSPPRRKFGQQEEQPTTADAIVSEPAEGKTDAEIPAATSLEAEESRPRSDGPIRISCDSCGCGMRAGRKRAGQTVECLKCGHGLLVPA